MADKTLVELLRDLDVSHPLAAPFGGVATRAAARIEELEGKQGRIPDQECFWLVERKVSPPLYADSTCGFTSDVWRAARFNTERQAHDYWRGMLLFRDECTVVEHMFINRT